MERWLVVYKDGHYSDGDEGVFVCERLGDATAFIERRMNDKANENPSLSNYTLYKAKQVELEAVEVVQKVMAKI